jgi:hypothetical protein
MRIVLMTLLLGIVAGAALAQATFWDSLVIVSEPTFEERATGKYIIISDSLHNLALHWEGLIAQRHPPFVLKEKQKYTFTLFQHVAGWGTCIQLRRIALDKTVLYDIADSSIISVCEVHHCTMKLDTILFPGGDDVPNLPMNPNWETVRRLFPYYHSEECKGGGCTTGIVYNCPQCKRAFREWLKSWEKTK